MTAKPVHEPIKDAAAQAISTNPFADMEDDLPWEVKP